MLANWYILKLQMLCLLREQIQTFPMKMVALQHTLRLVEDVWRHDLLMQAGADMNRTNKAGSTPLMYAVQVGRKQMIKKLKTLDSYAKLKEDQRLKLCCSCHTPKDKMLYCARCKMVSEL